VVEFPGLISRLKSIFGLFFILILRESDFILFDFTVTVHEIWWKYCFGESSR
jgi:hypothetical protein